MSTPSSVSVTPGSGKNMATYAISETTTKELGRVVVSDSAGTEVAPATAAKQPALGTAGSSSSDVLSVQGIASGTALPVTEADGANTTLGSKADAKSTATDTTAITIMQVLKQISASAQAPPSQAVTNAGTFAAQATEADGANVTLGAKADAKSTATDTTAITIMQVLKQISASVQAPPSQAVTNAGTFAAQAAQSGTWTVQPGNTANTTPWLVSETPATTGGVSTYSFLSTAAVQTAQIKGSAGQVYGIHFFNNSATIAYVRLYNQTGAPASTDGANIAWRGMVPANTSAAGFIVHMEGAAFGTGIGIRVTAAVADNDTTALSANVITGNVLYK